MCGKHVQKNSNSKHEEKDNARLYRITRSIRNDVKTREKFLLAPRE